MPFKERLQSLFPTLPDFGAIQSDLDSHFEELLTELKAIHATLDAIHASQNQGGTTP